MKPKPHVISSLFVYKQNDKPGYVVNNHLSRPAVASRLKRPTWKRDGQPQCFLFGLALNGVYMCPLCYQKGGSLLHCPSTLTGEIPGGTFLLHCPWSHLHQTLSGILPCKARTFLTWPLSVLSAAIIYPTYDTRLFYHRKNENANFFTHQSTLRLQILLKWNCGEWIRWEPLQNNPGTSEAALPRCIPAPPVW